MTHPFPSVLMLIVPIASAVAQAQPQPAAPLELVAQAEKLGAGGDKEDAILLLWDALEQLRRRTGQPESAAAAAAALGLLQTHDPLHADRLAACTAFARTQVDLALLYRGKKWYVAASECLDMAERFDRAVTAKERVLLAAAQKGVDALPSPAPHRDTLLQRAATHRAQGPWKERGDTLECGPHPANTPWFDWILAKEHADCELSIEFRSSDAKAGHDCALLVGLDQNKPFYQVIAAYYPDKGEYDFVVLERSGQDDQQVLGSAWLAPIDTPDGFHRLTFRVHGNTLRAQLDTAPPVEVKTRFAARGRCGVSVGIYNQASAAITLRNLQMQRWPPLTGEEQRAELAAATQQKVAGMIDAAASRLARKEMEAASLGLREALRDAERLPAGALRTSLGKSIDALLVKADLLQPRRKKAAQESARTFVALADRYAAAGHVRAADRLVRVAAQIDAESSAARLEAAQAAVDAWEKARGR